MSDIETQKQQLVKHLNGGLASVSIAGFINEISFEKLGVRPHGLPYSFYEVFFHITFAQKDILEYCESQNYQKREWPMDYWPKFSKPSTNKEWEDLKNEFFKDKKSLENFILDANNQLSEPVRNSEKHSLLREILLVLEHNAYHTGQLVLLQRLLGVYNN